MEKAYYQPRSTRILIGSILVVLGIFPVLLNIYLLRGAQEPMWKSLMFFVPTSPGVQPALLVLGILFSLLWVGILVLGLVYLFDVKPKLKLRLDDDSLTFVKLDIKSRGDLLKSGIGYFHKYETVKYKDIERVTLLWDMSREDVYIELKSGELTRLPVPEKSRQQVMDFIGNKAGKTGAS